jgi:hypothetical protein
VILQVHRDGSFVPLAETATDEHGRFVFHGLPVADSLFLVGANRDEVFYPGERVRLTRQSSGAVAKVRVFDALTAPSPLLARRHEINIGTESNTLRITESILISNPSSYCYVGGAEGKRPVTLALHIPSDFEKVTFEKEFYGRRFALIDGVLMTTIPWPPGERELTFTYILPIEKTNQLWERPLDLPCSDIRVSIVASDRRGPTCNLPALKSGPSNGLSFHHRAELLPAGHRIRVEFGRLPVPFSVYARWIALGVLGTLILAASAAMFRPRFQPKPSIKSAISRDQRRSHRHATPSIRAGSFRRGGNAPSISTTRCE